MYRISCQLVFVISTGLISILLVAATSDNLELVEAISEAASSHSVGSHLENENDNLSDMLSANVSERDTPNISGRNTPLSSAEVEIPEERPRGPDMPVMVEKANRDDVPDRFGKFEIKTELERKYCVFLVSAITNTVYCFKPYNHVHVN